MTAPLSTGNGGFRAYLFCRLSDMKSRFIAICLMSLFSFPMISAATDIFAYIELQRRIGPTYPETNADLEARLAVINLIASLLMTGAGILVFVLFLQGLFTAKASMRRLWNRKYTDMDMSLPVSPDTRFFGDVISGFGIYILPQLTAALLAYLLLLPTNAMSEQFRQLSAANPNSFDAGSMADGYRNLIGFLILANVMQYFFSLMIISFCGRKLTANIVPFVFGICIPVMIFFLCVIEGANCYGAGVSEFMYGPLWDCTPLGMIISSVVVYPAQYSWWMSMHLPFGLLYSAVFGAAAYFMIKHRREERTGSAFVYKPGRYATELVIMLSSASVIYLSALHDRRIQNSLYGVASLVYKLLDVPNAVLVTTWVAVNVIVFVIIELVSHEKLRRPKNLMLAAARFAVSAGISFLVCFGFAHSDGFGAGSYVPDVSDISRVQVTGYDESMVYLENYAMLSDENAKRIVTDFHRRIVAERPDMRPVYDVLYNNTEDYEGNIHFSVSYFGNDGNNMSRTYYLPVDYAKEFGEMWFRSGAFAATYNLPEKQPGAAVTVYKPGDKPDGYINHTSIPYERFAEAVKHDAQNATYEDILMHDGADYVMVLVSSGDYSMQLHIWDTFDETLALMREYNCETFENRFGNAVKYFMYKATSVGKYSAGTIRTWTTDDYGYPAAEYEPRDYRVIDEAQAKELLAHSALQTVYAGSRDIYVIVPLYEYRDPIENRTFYSTGASENYRFFVTEPNCDAAAEIYANAPAASREDCEKYLGEYYPGGDEE